MDYLGSGLALVTNGWINGSGLVGLVFGSGLIGMEANGWVKVIWVSITKS